MKPTPPRGASPPPATRHQRPLVWITGAGGLIGSHLVECSADRMPRWEVLALTRQDLDLTDFKAVDRLFSRRDPALIIHCAALSRNPECQRDPRLARLVNVEVTRHLAGRGREGGFILLSTDLVFDGRKGQYREDDPVNPLSVYAETKVDAEACVLANPRHTVVRTSLNGGRSPTGDRGFNEQLILAWKAGQVPRLFRDEFRCPIPAAVTAEWIWQLASSEEVGRWHLAGSERLSRWEIGRLVAARHPELHPEIEHASIHDYDGPPRPADTSLDSSRIQARFGRSLPGLGGWLETHPDAAF